MTNQEYLIAAHCIRSGHLCRARINRTAFKGRSKWTII